MYSKDPQIEQEAIKVTAALVEFHTRNPKKENPYEGMCYCASVCLKKLVGKLEGKVVILWKVKDHNGVWHWWCETPDGEVIDLTKEQYELNNNPVPSTSRASKLKEQGRIMSFKSYQKKIDTLMQIIEEKY